MTTRNRISSAVFLGFLFLLDLAGVKPLRADVYMQWPRGASMQSTWIAKAIKVTMGPRGRNMAVDKAGSVTAGGGVRLPPPDPCYDYAFVSRRNSNVDNIFFANTCTPEFRATTPNTSNRIAYSSLSGSLTFDEVAAVEIDLTDPEHPHPYLTTWRSNGTGNLPFYGFRDRFNVLSPAMGFAGTIAMVTAGTDWHDSVVRTGDVYSGAATEPPVVLHDDRSDTRTLGRIAWIAERDAAQPGFNKLVVAVRRGSFYEEGRASRDDVDRLYVLDAASGDFQPLKDPRDFANQDDAIEGKEPAVSQNGRKLAFIRNVYGLNRLWTCDLTLAPAAGEGGGFQCANTQMMNTDFHEPESSSGNYDWPCWSYDSKKIFFSFDGLRASTDNHPYSKIFMVDPDGTDLRRLSDGNPDGTDNTDNDSYPACMPLILHAAPYQATAIAQPVQQQYQAVPATQTTTAAPFRCDATHACPTGLTCGTDDICRRP